MEFGWGERKEGRIWKEIEGENIIKIQHTEI